MQNHKVKQVLWVYVLNNGTKYMIATAKVDKFFRNLDIVISPSKMIHSGEYQICLFDSEKLIESINFNVIIYFKLPEINIFTRYVNNQYKYLCIIEKSV